MRPPTTNAPLQSAISYRFPAFTILECFSRIPPIAYGRHPPRERGGQGSFGPFASLMYEGGGRHRRPVGVQNIVEQVQNRPTTVDWHRQEQRHLQQNHHHKYTNSYSEHCVDTAVFGALFFRAAKVPFQSPQGIGERLSLLFRVVTTQGTP